MVPPHCDDRGVVEAAGLTRGQCLPEETVGVAHSREVALTQLLRQGRGYRNHLNFHVCGLVHEQDELPELKFHPKLKSAVAIYGAEKLKTQRKSEEAIIAGQRIAVSPPPPNAAVSEIGTI